jgi:hypothetical protein
LPVSDIPATSYFFSFGASLLFHFNDSESKHMEVKMADQKITGVGGSPSATTTLDGKQLPPSPPKFGGVIKENAKESTPWWAPQVVPPKGAPNILLIMTDDQGYGVSSAFGGIIPTPAVDRIAEAGLRFTHFHSTALCSPRARRSSPAATITRWASE